NRDSICQIGIYFLVALVTVISIITKTWFSHTADSFGHISAIRSIIRYDNPLPQEIFFPVPVKEMSPIFGTWNLATAIVAQFAKSDLIIAWRFFNVLIAPLLVLSYASIAYSLSRRSDVALIATMLFLLLQQKLDLRTL